jgi:hypothetical protein
MTEFLYAPTKYIFARAKPAVAANPVRLRSPPKLLYHISANIVLLLLILLTIKEGPITPAPALWSPGALIMFRYQR